MEIGFQPKKSGVTPQRDISYWISFNLPLYLSKRSTPQSNHHPSNANSLHHALFSLLPLKATGRAPFEQRLNRSAEHEAQMARSRGTIQYSYTSGEDRE